MESIRFKLRVKIGVQRFSFGRTDKAKALYSKAKAKKLKRCTPKQQS
ncbi:MAG: hypothetical protein KAI83_14640 [Thiomargarita sp.]|nr:hypothetical protein [Thiomargarita sp.]